MKSNALVVVAMLVVGGVSATSPLPPLPLDESIDFFRRSVPVIGEELLGHLRPRLFKAKDEKITELLKDSEFCLASIRDEIVPELQRGIESKKTPEAMLLSFERLTSTLSDFRWCLDE